MRSLYNLADLNGADGKPVHSKILASFVTVAVVAMLWANVIDKESESFVVIALIGAAYGYDWGKSLIKSKYPPNGNEPDNGNPPADASHNGVA